MRKVLLLPAALVVAVLVSACAGLGLQQPGGFNDKLGYAYGNHTSVIQAATNALNANEITSEDAEHVLKLGEESKQVLDAARVAYNAGDIATAEGRLQLATIVLTELQTYLRERGVKEKPQS
jgi:hypothetical protein